MKIAIKHRFTGAVLFECEVADDDPRPMVTAIAKAMASYSNLSGSDLSCSDLSGSDLRGSNLFDSNLRYSNLSGSDLRGSDLSCSDLSYSNLRCSNLSGSDLSCSDLSGSDLRGSNLFDSNLRCSDLSGSDLRGSDLFGSNLRCISEDFHARLDLVPAEVPALLAAVRAGKIDGSAYQGECACFVGTIANLRDVSYDTMADLRPQASSATEKFFLGIRIGDTPETNPVSACVDDMIVEWQAMRGEGEWITEVES